MLGQVGGTKLWQAHRTTPLGLMLCTTEPQHCCQLLPFHHCRFVSGFFSCSYDGRSYSQNTHPAALHYYESTRNHHARCSVCTRPPPPSPTPRDPARPPHSCLEDLVPEVVVLKCGDDGDAWTWWVATHTWRGTTREACRGSVRWMKTRKERSCCRLCTSAYKRGTRAVDCTPAFLVPRQQGFYRPSKRVGDRTSPLEDNKLGDVPAPTHS